MNNDVSLNLHFDDYSESCYLMRFGKREHLEQIKNGNLRFSSLKKYWHIEGANIGDRCEGLDSVYHKDENTQFSFYHPSINDGKEVDTTGSILSMWDYPDTRADAFTFKQKMKRKRP